MLKVLAIFPAFDPQINEMAMVWQRLCQTGLVDCTVVASRTDRLKAHESSADTEKYPQLSIHRLRDQIGSHHSHQEIVSTARAYHPDWIFCEIPDYLPTALTVKKQTGARIMVRTDYFLDDTIGLRRRWYLGQRWLRPYVFRFYRRLLASRSDVVLSSNPVDFSVNELFQRSGKLKYLPWPHPTAGGSTLRNERDSLFSAYIGSLSRAKGADVLADYFVALLCKNPDFKLALIGPTIDKAGAEAIARVRDIGGSRVDLRAHCSRAEAIKLISRSLFVLSPGKRLGWGLIGDAWSAGTPVVAHAQHYDLDDGKNCLVASDSSSFLEAVIQLQSDQSIWSGLSMAGIDTVRNLHSVEVVMGCLGSALGLYLQPGELA